mgnify:CR=1 FL=1
MTSIVKAISALAASGMLAAPVFADFTVTKDTNTWQVGGFVELENTYTDKSGADAQYGMQVNRTRFYIKSAHDTEQGKLTTRVEYDFGGKTTDTDVEPRLRHAVINWNGWTAGQTSSTFSNPEANHETVDDAMPAAITGLSSTPDDRNPQLAYGAEIGNGLSYKAGFEKPATDASTVRPLFAARLAYDQKGALAWSLAAASYEDANGDSWNRGLIGARLNTGAISYRAAFVRDNGIDGRSASASVRYTFDQGEWLGLTYEKARVAEKTGDRAYLSLYQQLASNLEAGIEYSKRGLNADNTETDIARVDLKARF